MFLKNKAFIFAYAFRTNKIECKIEKNLLNLRICNEFLIGWYLLLGSLFNFYQFRCRVSNFSSTSVNFGRNIFDVILFFSVYFLVLVLRKYLEPKILLERHKKYLLLKTNFQPGFYNGMIARLCISSSVFGVSQNGSKKFLYWNKSFRFKLKNSDNPKHFLIKWSSMENYAAYMLIVKHCSTLNTFPQQFSRPDSAERVFEYNFWLETGEKICMKSFCSDGIFIQ